MLPLREIKYGLEPNFYYLSREQQNLGDKVSIITKNCPSIEEGKHRELDGLTIHRPKKPFSFFAVKKIIELCDRDDSNIVHTHATSLFVYAFLNKVINKRINGRYVVHVHGTTRGTLKYITDFANRLPEIEYVKRRGNLSDYASILRQAIVWRQADAVIAVSKFLANELVTSFRIHPSRVYVVYNGVDTRIFYHNRNSRKLILKELAITEDQRIILFLGGYRPTKGSMVLLRAIREMKNRGYGKRICVLFIGDTTSPIEQPYMKKILNLVQSYGISRMIRLHQPVPHLQMPKYYSLADLLVVPSLYESFSKATVEAMACETPVIASRVGGLPEIVEDGVTGLLFPPANPKRLADLILSLLEDEKEAKKMGKEGRRRVSERFTWRRAADTIKREVYSSLI